MKIRSLKEAEQVLATFVPVTKHITGKDITLDRTRELLALLGNPQAKLRVVHVAGTSGKTSTSYYMSALLTQAGQKTGLTVSPHVDRVSERLQINGRPVTDAVFCEALGELLELIKPLPFQPSYFEVLIALAYWFFAREAVDYAVMETGMGGLHDSTNIAEREDKVCVLTDIGFDHMHVLGYTLAQIATQKAGIMHAGNHAFTFKQPDEVTEVFKKEAHQRGATLHILDNDFNAPADIQTLPLYQQRNWALASQAFLYLQNRDQLPVLSDEQLVTTMRMQPPGRMETLLLSDKQIIMDGAHNEPKMEAFTQSFEQRFPNQRATVLLSLKEDKTFETILPLLKPITQRLIVTAFQAGQDLPSKAIDPAVIAEAAKQQGIADVIVEPDYRAATQALLDDPNALAVITGSFYLLSQVRPLLELPI